MKKEEMEKIGKNEGGKGKKTLKTWKRKKSEEIMWKPDK